MAKVGLVNPAITSAGWNAKLRHDNGSANLPRKGLCYLSAALKEAGHEPVLLDLRMMKDFEEYDRRVAQAKPDVVAVTALTDETPYALEACRRAKAWSSNVKTVVGGIHPTIDPKCFLQSGVVDNVLCGEGEISFPKYCSDPSSFPKVSYGDMPDLDKIPFPDMDLYPDYRERITYNSMPGGQAPNFWFPVPQVDLVTKRGCPWQCRFCCGPGEQNLYTRPRVDGSRAPAVRGNSVKRAIAELQYMQEKYRFKSFSVADDQFIFNPKWNWEFTQALHDIGFVKKGITWTCFIRADMICRNQELVAAMGKAGLRLVQIGFESFSQAMLDFIEKGTTVEQNVEAAKILRRNNMGILANYILGMPRDGGWHREDDQMTVDAIRAIQPDVYSPSFFAPLPGCDLYQYCVDNDLIVYKDVTSVHDAMSAAKPMVRDVDYDFLKSIVLQGPPPRLGKRLAVQALKSAGLYDWARDKYRVLQDPTSGWAKFANLLQYGHRQ